MQRDEIINLIDSHREKLRQLGVRSLALFGSVARDAATQSSDVDVLVEFDRPTGIFGLIRVEQYLESLLGRKVDVGTSRSLKSRIRERVLAEAIRVA
jgi:uncharacterized protein